DRGAGQVPRSGEPCVPLLQRRPEALGRTVAGKHQGEGLTPIRQNGPDAACSVGAVFMRAPRKRHGRAAQGNCASTGGASENCGCRTLRVTFRTKPEVSLKTTIAPLVAPE